MKLSNPFRRRSNSPNPLDPKRVGGRRNYAMGQNSRLTADWFSAELSAEDAIFQAASVTRRRAQDLERNDPHVRRFLQMVNSNVFGHVGIRLKPEARRPDGSLDEADNKAIRNSFMRWGKVGTCTIDGRLAWAEVESMILRRILVDGEVLVRKIKGPVNPHGFALQILDASMLDEYKTQPRGSGRNKISQGIEMDRNDRPIAYHLTKANGPEGATQRIPAEEMQHLFMQERPHQYRGITWLAPVGLRQKMLDSLEVATVIGARIAASKMGFFTSEEGSEYVGDSILDGNATGMDISAGAMEKLPAGMKFEPFDPSWPPSNFGDLEKQMKRSLASGLGVSYVTLANDLEGVSYSSIRQGELSDRDFWRCMQAYMVRHCSDLIYDDWLLMALSFGQITDATGQELPLRRLDKFSDRSWRPRGWAWVDPLKEVQAAEKSIALLIKSRSEIVAEQGGEFSEIADQLQADNAIIDGNGLTVTPDDSPAPAPEGDPDNE